MTNKPLTITRVSTSDIGGGAEKIASDIFQASRAHGHSTRLVVGYKHGNDPDVLVISHQVRRGWSRLWWRIYSRLQSLDGRIRGVRRLRRLSLWLAEPRILLDAYRGVESFHFPGTWRLLKLTPQPPDIVHCHNLHGGYFDLRVLPWLSRQVPVVLTLEDIWLLSGHCAYSFDCERWKIGCGHCPDLTIYPSISRDATAYNWRRKRDIFAQSQFYVSTSSHWTMQKVEQSMLIPAIVGTRIIPNGVDLSVFHPVDQQVARAALGIPPDVKMLLFVANGIRKSRFKDYQTIQAAVTQIAEHFPGQSVRLVGLGEDAPSEQIGQIEVCFVPYQKDPKVVAHYYQAADVYVHAAKAETWGRVITEALACGMPVVATAVGGIPEQVKSLPIAGCNLNSYHLNEATGILVPPRDAQGMAMAIEKLLNDGELRRQLGENAARDARCRFDLEQQVEAYLNWYQEIIERQGVQSSTY